MSAVSGRNIILEESDYDPKFQFIPHGRFTQQNIKNYAVMFMLTALPR